MIIYNNIIIWWFYNFLWFFYLFNLLIVLFILMQMIGNFKLPQFYCENNCKKTKKESHSLTILTLLFFFRPNLHKIKFKLLNIISKLQKIISQVVLLASLPNCWPCLYLEYKCILWQICTYVTLEHKTSLKSPGYICSKIHCVGQNDWFLFYAKIIRTLSKDHVPWGYFVNFLLYIYKNVFMISNMHC